MRIQLENVLPGDIEKRSFELIEQELKVELDPKLKPIIKRVIHTTADFEYLDNLCFSENVVDKGMDAIKNGAIFITDTNMGKAGINKKALERFGNQVYCYMDDVDVAEYAKEHGVTRAVASVEKAAKLNNKIIYVVGNAPTALIRLYELITEGKIKPEVIIGVPVGFVNVVESKELIMKTNIPYIVARGRKGGSNVAASICNALLYMIP